MVENEERNIRWKIDNWGTLHGKKDGQNLTRNPEWQNGQKCWKGKENEMERLTVLEKNGKGWARNENPGGVLQTNCGCPTVAF